MEIGSLFGSGSSSGLFGDKKTFGAQVVSSTLNLMNGSQDDQDLGDITDKKTFGAAVVVKTLGFMNNSKRGGSSHGSSNSLFQVNQSVLGAHYGGTGSIFDTTT